MGFALENNIVNNSVCALANGLVEAVSSLLGISNGIVNY